ncbi:MAG: hypothetical protein VKK80_07155 [Prochlorothrix sp.]|nr:hypothetical protein [Prochlorothrix sp.]
MNKTGKAIALSIGTGVVVLVLFRLLGQLAYALARMFQGLSYWGEEAGVAAAAILFIYLVFFDKDN